MSLVASVKDKISERRLDRMRLGQATCDFVPLPSDPEIRLALVPLFEAEYIQALNAVAETDAPVDLAGMQLRDRKQAQEILVRAIRESDDLMQRVYADTDEMMEQLEVTDIDELLDRYNEMCENSSPRMERIPPEEFENLKKALQEMDWNVLSGRAWYAAKRFLSAISPSPLTDNSPGSTSTNSSTTTSE
jgi:hypothetical protein